MNTIEALVEYYSPANVTRVSPSGFAYQDTSSVLREEILIEGATERDIFIKFYKMNNKLRYCNGSYYSFKDVFLNSRYNTWLNSSDFKSIHFSLYYGGGIVD